MRSLPNTRSAIIPDPGMALVECDLRQADAQVVAWSSDCRTMKSLLRRRVDIYTENETHVWDDPRVPGGGQYPPPRAARQLRKNVVHSGDYGAGAPTIGDKYMAGDRSAAAYFLQHWFAARPEIRDWQQQIAHRMQKSRTPTVYNAWGFRRVYACQVPVTQPLAWIGQSTVSIVKDKIMIRIDGELPEAELLLESHDSVLMQLPQRMCPDIFPRLLSLCEIEIPFPNDPLVIPAEIKWSLQNWGNMEEWDGATAR